MEVGAAEFSPGCRLAAAVAKGIAVVNNVLSEGVHGFGNERFNFGVLRSENVIGKLIDEEVADNFVRAGVALIDDIADVIAGADEVVPKSFRNLSGGVNFYAAEVFAVEEIAGRVAVLG